MSLFCWVSASLQKLCSPNFWISTLCRPEPKARTNNRPSKSKVFCLYFSSYKISPCLYRFLLILVLSLIVLFSSKFSREKISFKNIFHTLEIQILFQPGFYLVKGTLARDFRTFSPSKVPPWFHDP
jgi:hypothetical protein